MSKWFRITEITEWDVNRRTTQSYADLTNTTLESALGEAQTVARNYLEDGEGMELPWTVEAASEDEALAKYSETFYEGFSLAIPVKAEIEEVRKFEVTRQIDCQDTVVVFAKDSDEALDRADETDVDMDELKILEIHNVRTTDAETGASRELYLQK